MGDIPSNAAYTHGHGAGIGIPGDHGRKALSADVHVHAADHHHIGARAQHIALPGDKALFHQVGNMNRHRGAGDPRLFGQLLLGDHRIFLDPAKDLAFTLGHCVTSNK